MGTCIHLTDSPTPRHNLVYIIAGKGVVVKVDPGYYEL
jgi:hypothetical protein